MTPFWAPSPVTAPADGGGRNCLSASSGRREPSSCQWESPPVIARAPVDAGASLPATQPAAACTLSPQPESVRAGRAFTRATLAEWGMGELADVAELVVSELVTNALRHGLPSAPCAHAASAVRLRLLAQHPFVMCMVSDPGLGIPVLRQPGLAAESGRGLTVVESCSVRWGWHLLDEGGKVVWALLSP